MLDFVYYPVSAVLWFWHTVFGFLLGPASGLGWVLSVVFLVLTLRALFVPLFLRQARTQALMKVLAPKFAALKEKYPDDLAQRATEQRKLLKDNKINGLATFLPILAQILVFIGLFHVLRSFDRTQAATSLPFLSPSAPMAPEQNAATANYLFSPADVQSFLQADLFGAPLSASVAAAGELLTTVALVAIPLMLISAIATHFTARRSLDQQARLADRFPSANPDSEDLQQRMNQVMRPLTLWLFPVGTLVFGQVLPVAILLYFLTNNAFTFVQQHLIHRRIDTEITTALAVEAQRAQEERLRAQERAKAAAPKPGSKPRRRKA